MDTVVEVAVALILDGDKILIGRRPPHKLLPGKWEFPGGKIEPGETAEECVVREIQEEFGVLISTARPFLVWEYEYGSPVFQKFRFTSFLCAKPISELRPIDHDAFAWVPVRELHGCGLLEADAVIVDALLRQ